MDRQRDSYPIDLLCWALEVSRSGYADWRARGKTAPRDAEHRLVAQIRVVHAQSRGTYGAPRITRTAQVPGND